MKKIILICITLICSILISFSQLINTKNNIENNIENNNNIELYTILEEYIFDDMYMWDSQSINVWNNKDIPNSFNIDFRDMQFPLKKTYVTSNYGYRKKFRRNHQGIDLKAQIGDTVYAAFDGKVRISRYNKGGYGQYLVIRHNYNIETVYGHLSKFLVERNAIVKAGDPIALSGNTGRSTGPHLHFEVRFMGIALNLNHIINFNQNKLITQNYKFEKNNYK